MKSISTSYDNIPYILIKSNLKFINVKVNTTQ